MNENKVALVAGERFRLEPGDGTRYEFSLLDVDQTVCSGIGPNSEDYVTLVVHSPGRGSYEVGRNKLRRPAAHFAGYLREYFACDFYTLMAITLACSVLIDRPYDLNDAAKEMLRVPEFQ